MFSNVKSSFSNLTSIRITINNHINDISVKNQPLNLNQSHRFKLY